MIRTGYAFRFISAVVIFICWIAFPFIKLLNKKRRTLVTRATNPLFTYSASEIARKIRRKQIPCEEVVTVFVQRIRDVNPILNAVVEDRFEAAIEEAKEVDRFLAATELGEDELESKKPLLGVPMTIKENLSLKGLSQTLGCVKRLGVKAEEDGDCVKALKEAGVIPLCVTTTPEYCLSVETYNKVTGATNNPYNTRYISGGSSGGEGALIGSGASVCGLGSDIAGSIRIPCAFNGIFGHKPSPGLIPLKGHFPMSDDPRFTDHLSIGPMCRYPEDLPLITKVLAGSNADRLKLDQPVILSELRILHMDEAGFNFGTIPVQEEIKDAIKLAVDHLKQDCDAEISDIKFEEMKLALEVGVASHFAIKDKPDIIKDMNVYVEIVKALLGKSDHPFNTLIFALGAQNKSLIPGKIEEHDAFIKMFRDKLLRSLGDNGVFLFPSYPTSALPHMGSLYGTMGTLYCLIINVLGLPSTNVPVGFDKKGLPIGIQVIASPDQDRICFAVAKELERVFGGWKPPY